MSVLVTLFALSIVIFIHECGHLFFAKWGKIGVFEFSVGMGPKLFGYRYKDTDYNFRLFPFGGFVRLAGLDESNQEVATENLFQNRPMFWRFSTLFAGSFMNVLLGFFVFFLISFFVGVPNMLPSINSVLNDSPAMEAGLQKGDVLISIDKRFIGDVYNDFIKKIHNASHEVDLVFERSGVRNNVQIRPFYDEKYDVYRIGVQLDSESHQLRFFSALGQSFKMTMSAIRMVFYSFSMLLSGEASMKDLSGPIGIVQVATFQLSQNIIHFFSIIAFISITLGIINLFPIPVLDGGHIMFLFYEMLFKKPVPKKVWIVLNNFFALCLIVLMIVVVVNDIRFWGDRVDVFGVSND